MLTRFDLDVNKTGQIFNHGTTCSSFHVCILECLQASTSKADFRHNSGIRETSV